MSIITFPVSNRDPVSLSAAEFARRYLEARQQALRMSIATRSKLAAIYRAAADEAADVVKDALERGLSDLTTERWAAIAADLTRAADELAGGVEVSARSLISSTSTLLPGVGAEFAIKAAAAAGAESVVTRAGIQRMVAAANTRAMASLVSRLWADGQTFSSRIWGEDGIRVDWLERIRLTVSAGLAQGRDPVKIAKDIQVYAADGKVALVQRWGALERGVAGFAKRIPGRVDWRAARLVRSELSASLQDGAISAGQINPGCDGLFDWVLSASREHNDCDCEALAAGGPYEAGSVPTYPHPNCHPAGTLILTMRGDVPIEQVVPGDLVVSHDGTVQRVLNSWKNNYDGELLRFVTHEGAVEATPEHPLLVSGAWRPANTLQDGDSLTRVSVGIEAFSDIKAEANNSPSAGFKERGLFRVLSLLPGSGMPVPAIDFNGELFILKGKVDSVPTYDEVRDRLFFSSSEGFVHHAFVGRPEVSGIELRLAGLLFVRYGPTPDGIMCGAGISLTPICISSAKTIGNIRKSEAKRDKVAVDAVARDFETLSYLIDRETLVPEELREFCPIKIDSSTHSSAIVSVVSNDYKGIVYNLSVENTHSYIANGFASHNCLCWVRPHLRDQREFVSDLRRWAQGADVDYLDAWYRDQYKAAA